MILQRKASGLWRGGIKSGTGIIVSGSSRSDKIEFPFVSGFGEKKLTSPEDLLAAAHVASFSIMLAQELERHGLDSPLLHADATLTMELLENGWTVVAVHLRVFAQLPETEHWNFVSCARHAARNCGTARLFQAKCTVDAQIRGAELSEVPIVEAI